MILTSENNWYQWNYGVGEKFGRRTNKDERLVTSFLPYTGKIKSFRQELNNVASSIRDHYSNLSPCVMFSGGADSEVVIRSFLDIGITPDVYIFRYENDYNIYDVSYAITVCSMLGINYKLIDFNLKKFYENDAEQISEISQIDRPQALPQLKFMDYVDGLPVYGASDISLTRSNDNYSAKGTWNISCWEHDVGWSKYAKTINRPAVMEWFKWTPGVVISVTQLQWFKNLIDDQYIGKLGTNSTKILGYQEAYQDIINRSKKTGFEKLDTLSLELEKFFEHKYKGLIFRDTCQRSLVDLYTQILGNNYSSALLTG